MPALAQEGDEAGDSDDVIVVTAQKREQNQQDVPVAITALGNKKLAELQVKELQDAVKYLPSVTLQKTNEGTTQIYFRGLASGENANHSTSQPTVGVYLDEMPITTIQGPLDIQAYDLARVEALAGPQGTLYGASSMAGTIKLVTNAPDMSGNYGGADFELNTVAHGAIGGIAQGFYNAKISDDAAMRLVGWYRHDAGYIDNILGSRTYKTSGITDTNAALVEDNYNDADIYGARLALGIDLDDNWTLRPTVMGQVQKANGNGQQERSSAVTKKLQMVQYNPERNDDKWLQAALTIEGKIGDWDLVATGGQLWRETHRDNDYSDYSYFYDALYDYGAYFYDDNGDYISPNQYIEAVGKYRRSFGELRISSPQENRLRFIGGVFAQRQKHNILEDYIVDDETDYFVVPGTESDIWLTHQKRVDRDYAAFGELSYDITDQFTITGGARLYNYKNSLVGFFGFSGNFSSGTGVAACFGPAIVKGTPCTNIDKVTSDTDAIYKVNATYKITDDAMVYATWSQGFRPGGINRRGTLPPYRPDKLDNYEIGWKTQFGPLRFNGAIYQEDWNDIQLSFLGANGLSEVRNAGIARVRGVEAEIGYREGGFSLTASGSYNDAKITRDFCAIAVPSFDCTVDVDLDGSGAIDDGSEFNALLSPAGTRLPVTPKFKGNLVARYTFPLGDWDAHVQGAFAHVGKRRSDLRTLENAIKGMFPSFNTVDASIGAENGTFRVELFATNLFDSNGILDASVQCVETTCGDPGNVSNTGGVFYNYPIRPRTVGLKFGVDF
ncbi:TonB-dependent receptor [Altererythrobacter salegens]|uniref:TonB-dependent receptor n=2 Tax=Croceibacterium salegens TaxID=1737568 RepID=A0A6I4SZD3_9SPHN|nr:TonB-dependent receptor [Croceibacterium salegens]